MKEKKSGGRGTSYEEKQQKKIFKERYFEKGFRRDVLRIRMGAGARKLRILVRGDGLNN